MTTRRGAARGTGRGYKNLRNYPRDPKVHAESARGVKQPQRINRMLVVSHYTKGKDMPVKEVGDFIADLKPKTVAPAQSASKGALTSGFIPVAQIAKPVKEREGAEFTEVGDDFLSKVAEKQEKKPSKVVSYASKAGSAALAFGREKLREYQAAARTKSTEKHEKYIEELRDVEHPLVKKRDKIEGDIDVLETKISAGVGDEDRNFEQLEILKEKLADIEDKLDHLDLSTFTDEQLKGLAVRETGGDDLFSMDTGNKYESELLRRIEYRKELDKKMSEAHHAKKEKEGGLFDF